MVHEMHPMSETRFGVFRARYDKARTEKERAHIEHEAWMELPASERTRLHRRSWLRSAFKTSAKGVEFRASLLLAEPDSEILWKRIEHDNMPLSTAGSQLSQAKKLQEEEPDLSLAKALELQLQEYDSWPVQRNKSGVLYHKRPPGRLAARHLRKPYKMGKWDQRSERGFWSELRKHLAEFLQARFEGLDPFVAERLYRDFERDLKVLFGEYQSKLSRARVQEKRTANTLNSANFTFVKEACAILGMDPPKRGEPVNLDAARQRKKKLARVYHPDANGGGNEGTNAKYHEVLNAFSALEEYNDQFRSSQQIN